MTQSAVSEEMQRTLDPQLKSWVEGSTDSDFPIQSLPFGIFTQSNNLTARVGVAIGTQILDLAALHQNGLLKIEELGDAELSSNSLNALIAKGPAVRKKLRQRLSQLLASAESSTTASADLRENQAAHSKVFLKQEEAKMLLPVHVGDFVDFYSSLEHATNVGTMFRDASNPLLPNWKHIPIGYHGRSSSLYVSGQEFHRPKGQLKAENEPPIQAPSRMLDFELEMGFIVGKDTAPGESVTAKDAGLHMFGMVLVNDWSARDIQKWEYVPLGPSLEKALPQQ